jgi:hypothetical protein
MLPKLARNKPIRSHIAMSIALLDNATLTAVQRITGAAVSRSRASVDVDLLAYENYVQARLFYDSVVVVDDYISAHRQARIDAFANVTFIDKNDLKLKEISATAAEISDQIRPEIRGGDFADHDLKALFELLQTHMVCTWDIASSVYHLTLKVLAESGSDDFKKYGAVASAIFQELSDASNSGRRVSPEVELVDRFGHPITEGYHVPGARWGSGESSPDSSTIEAFVAALVWLSNRAIYYTLVSAHIKADSFLYPIRQAYQQYYLAKTLRYDQEFPKRLVTKLGQTLSRDVTEIINGGELAAGAIDLPIFSAWLVNNKRDSLDALEELETTRRLPDFVDAREQLADLKALFENSDRAAANRKIAKISDRLNAVSNRMRQKYSIETAQGVPLTRMVAVYNGVATLAGLPTLPKIDARVKLPTILSDIRRETGLCSIYRNAVNDLTTFARLGNLKDVLGRRVRIDPKAHVYSAKAEAPRFRASHSPFKSPM